MTNICNIKTMAKQVVCYANKLGDCSNIQSKEHYISQGIFSDNNIDVSGQDWVKGQSKSVSYKKIGVPVLCDYHNRKLSPLDAYASKFSRKLWEIIDASSVRMNSKRHVLKPKITANFDGFPLEQWMIKAALGSMYEDRKNLRWHPNGNTYDDPPIEILEALFGLRRLDKPMGLFLPMGKGDLLEGVEMSAVNHLKNADTHLFIGCLIFLRDIRFLISLTDDNYISGFPEYVILDNGRLQLFGSRNDEPTFRPEELKWSGQGVQFASIFLDWKEPFKLL